MVKRWLESRAATWGRKGFATILDQAAFAGGNFALNILMARWLTPEAYGTFAVAHTLFLIAATAYAGLVMEPMLIFGSAKHRERARTYLGSILHLHWYYSAIALACFLVAAIAVRATGPSPLTLPLLAVAVSTPLMLILWVGRKACYLWLDPWRAAKAGFVYVLLLLPAAFLLHRAGWLGPASALLLMGGASVLAGGWVLASLGPERMLRPEAGFLRGVVHDHWDYGRWSATTRFLNWVPGHIYFLVLPLWIALEAAGSLKALLNLLNPLIHSYAAVTVLFMTVLVRLREDGGFDRLMRRGVVAFSALAIAFWLVLGFFGQEIVGFLYSGKYVGDAGLLWILGAVPFLNGLTAFMTAGLRALEEPEKVFYIYLGATLVALTVGLPLMRTMGLFGASVGLVASGASGAIVAAVILGRTRRTVWLGQAAPAGGEA